MIVIQQYDKSKLDHHSFDFVDFSKLVQSKNPTIVQVGAYDGVLGEEYGFHEYLESLNSFNLFLVEPIKHFFDNLKNVYEKYGDKIKYCNHAISNVDGDIFMIEQGCMSKIDTNGTLKVQSKTWNSFLKENQIDKIDLLLLDCEGFEFEILKNAFQTNENKVKPNVIRYEYLWISDKTGCDNLLLSNQYKIDYCKFDPIYNKVACSLSNN